MFQKVFPITPRSSDTSLKRHLAPRKLQVGILIAVSGIGFLTTSHDALAQITPAPAPAPTGPQLPTPGVMEDLGYQFHGWDYQLQDDGTYDVYAGYVNADGDIVFVYYSNVPGVPRFLGPRNRPITADEAKEPDQTSISLEGSDATPFSS